jgi:hypothetical protein
MGTRPQSPHLQNRGSNVGLRDGFMRYMADEVGDSALGDEIIARRRLISTSSLLDSNMEDLCWAL